MTGDDVPPAYISHIRAMEGDGEIHSFTFRDYHFATTDISDLLDAPDHIRIITYSDDWGESYELGAHFLTLPPSDKDITCTECGSHDVELLVRTSFFVGFTAEAVYNTYCEEHGVELAQDLEDELRDSVGLLIADAL